MKFRIMLILASLGFLSLTACPGHGQVPPTTSTVTLTITAPAGCSSGCTYVYSRALVPSASTACPASTGTSYSPLNASSPATGLTYTDSTASGDFACYIAQTEQSGLVSTPSNIVGPETVPAQPTAPNLSGSVVGDNQVPLKPSAVPAPRPALVARVN